MAAFKNFDFSVNNELWKDVLWDDSRKIMLMSNKPLTRRIFMYIFDKKSLTPAELKKLETEFMACKKVEGALEILDKFVLQEK